MKHSMWGWRKRISLAHKKTFQIKAFAKFLPIKLMVFWVNEWLILSYQHHKRREKNSPSFSSFSSERGFLFQPQKSSRERKYSDISDHTVKLTRKSCCAAMHQSKLPQVMNNNGRKECNFASTVAAAVAHLWPCFIENIVKEMDHCFRTIWQLPK